jgi:capsular polysaccharide biosynthesis protein
MSVTDKFVQINANSKARFYAADISRKPLPLLLERYVNQYLYERHLNQVTQIPDLGFYTFNNVFVGPLGIVLSSELEMYIADDIQSRYTLDQISGRLDGGDDSDVILRAFRGQLDVGQAVNEGVVVSLAKPGHQVYGHWIIDILPMVWLFLRCAERIGLCPNHVTYLLPSNTPSWAFTLLSEAFDIKKEQIICYDQTSYIQVRTLVLPSMLRIGDSFSPLTTRYANDIMARFQDRVHPDLPKHIFISRKGVSSFVKREAGNIETLEEMAIARGFTLIEPSSMKWPDQIALFSQAEIIVGLFGSGMHNTIFSKPSMRSLVLSSSQMNQIQTCISALKMQRMAYLFPDREERRNDGPTFFYNEDDFSTCLDSLSMVDHHNEHAQ